MKDISFSEVKKALGLPLTFRIPESLWRPIDSFFDKLPEYLLSNDKLVEILGLFDIEDKLVGAIIEKLMKVKNSKYWSTLLYHLYDFMFLENDFLEEKENPSEGKKLQNIIRTQKIIGNWPRLTHLLGKDSSLFYVFPYLYRVPDVLAIYKRRGLPEDIALATLKDLFLWIYEYKRQYGEWGLMELGWFMLHFNLKLFQLGRLQFELSHFEYDFHVFKSLEKSEILMLAGDEMKFRADGQFFDADNSLDENYWESHYEESDEEYIGYVIDKDGFATRKIIQLKKERWVEVLKKNDDALGVHIPAGGPPPGHGPMDSRRCDESFSMARDFFPKYFPMKRFNFFICTSWMLDPQLKLYLNDKSNIVAFQERFYLHPVPGADDKQIYQRVFSHDESLWASAPAITSLQKIVRAHETKGGKWRMGGGVAPL